VIQKAIPSLQLSSTGLSGNVQTLLIGDSLYSVQISPVESEEAQKAAVKNGSCVADISDCIKTIKAKLNLPATVQLIQITTTKDQTLNLDNINNDKNNKTPSISIALYRSDTLAQVDTSVCGQNNMFVALPVKNTRGVNMKLFNRLSKDGIDGFDKNDEAFNDKCYSFRDIGGGDTTVNSRRKYYFQGMEAGCYTSTAQCTYFGVAGGYLNCGCQADPSKQVVSTFTPVTLPEVSPINIEIYKCISNSFSVSYFNL
jgi:hypothetical protein